MKHLLIILAMATITLSGDLLAQEQAIEPANTVSEAVEKESKSRITYNIDIDDETDAEKLAEIADLVGKYNSELGDELKVELEGLSESEKEIIISKLEGGFDTADIPDGAVAISIIAILAVFGLPVFLLIVFMTSGHRRRKQKMELVNLYIANDKELPEHVITAFDTGGAANSLRSGLVLVAVGLGLAAGFSGNAGNFGLIPLFLGLARLIYWYLEERKPKQQ